MNKKIYFDTTFLHYGEDLRGIPQVIFQLIHLILQKSEFDEISFIATSKVRQRFLVPLGIDEKRIELVAPVPFVPDDILFHGFLCTFRYRRILKKARMVFHPEYRTVLKTAIPQLVLYYDFIFLHDYSPQNRSVFLLRFFKYMYVLYLKHKLRRSTKAIHKIAISEHTRQDFVSLFPNVPAAEISVLHIGIRSLPQSGLLPEKNVSFPVQFLCVGGVDDYRKNYNAMINHMEEIVGQNAFHLHLVGKCNQEYFLSLSTLISKKNLVDCITFHGILSDEQLSLLYEKSHFFLFPSLFEGFGLPILEAMSRRCVVCAFNNSSIPEIGGNAIICAENNDFRFWGQSLDSLIKDASAYVRLSAAGVQQAARFSEEHMFERYGNYLRTLVSNIKSDEGECGSLS
jgi:glycosyltransferase involved in cell wall biosynthesis